MARTAKKKAVATRNTSTALASVEEQMRKEAANIGDTTSSSIGSMIKLDQKNGAYFEVPGVGRAEAPMDVVIVDYLSRNTYYPGRFDENNIVPPDCFAIGKNIKELVPSKNSPVVQSDACSGCPNNEWESDPLGGKGKACKNTRLLAVLPPDAAPDAEIMLISVSPTGIKNFDTYITGLASKFGALPVGMITELSMVPSGKGYTLAFGNPRRNENLSTDYARRDEAMALLMTEPDTSAPAATAAPKRRTTKKRAARR